MKPAELPLCAVCQRPVERLDREDCPMTQVVRFTAHCHGERQVVELGEDLLCDLGELRMGEAFKDTADITQPQLCPTESR